MFQPDLRLRVGRHKESPIFRYDTPKIAWQKSTQHATAALLPIKGNQKENHKRKHWQNLSIDNVLADSPCIGTAMHLASSYT